MAASTDDLFLLSAMLDEAMDLDAIERDRWKRTLSGRRRDLLPRVAALLEAGRDDRAERELADGPRLPGVAGDGDGPSAGDLVGPYRLLRVIGHGGMGSVWLAERWDGALRRKVALKLPRLAWDTGLASRMARERDIGALLEHPNIARLYDAGVDERGRPYLAMECVDGRPIDVWCRDLRLEPRAILRLFVHVVRAVSYAHGRLVVHRDLKPSNILVNDDGVHLLDFGIAKLLDEGASEEAALTQVEGRHLTPRYASPEQIAGQPVSVASDVYSLGILLFELLTGTTPFDRDRSRTASDELARIHSLPPLASGRARGKALARFLRGDVDAIVNTALKPDPMDRYASAEAMADDIDRFLAGECVRARPDRRAYRWSRLVRRHRTVTLAAALVLLLVVVAIVVGTAQARRAEQAEERAAVTRAFVRSLLVDHLARPGEPVMVEPRRIEDVLERGAERVESRFAHDPVLQAAMYATLVDIAVEVGSKRLASRFQRRLLDLREPPLQPAAVSQSLAPGAGAPLDAQVRDYLETQRALIRVLSRVDPVPGAPGPDIAE